MDGKITGYFAPSREAIWMGLWTIWWNLRANPGLRRCVKGLHVQSEGEIPRARPFQDQPLGLYEFETTRKAGFFRRLITKNWIKQPPVSIIDGLGNWRVMGSILTWVCGSYTLKLRIFYQPCWRTPRCREDRNVNPARRLPDSRQLYWGRHLPNVGVGANRHSLRYICMLQVKLSLGRKWHKAPWLKWERCVAVAFQFGCYPKCLKCGNTW